MFGDNICGFNNSRLTNLVRSFFKPVASHLYYVFLFLFLLQTCFYLSCNDEPDEDGGDERSVISGSGVLPGERLVRVLLADGLSECRIDFDGRLDIVCSQTGMILSPAVSLKELTFMFEADGIECAELDEVFGSGSIDLRPYEEGPMGVWLGEELFKFRGYLRLLVKSDGTGRIINVVDVEDYLVGVVAGELDRRFGEEAFRAQAIVARTYVWYQMMMRGASRVWDVKSTEGSQVYGDVSRSRKVPEASTAVRDTRGLVCTWFSREGERIFCTYYSSRCGGVTQASGPVKHEETIAPLAGGVKCSYCMEHPFKWGPVRLEKSFITERLRDRYSRFTELGEIVDIEVLSSSADGRSVELSFIDGEGGSIKLEAENFRLAIDPTGRTIMSTYFVPVVEEDAIILTAGRGFGHGMGMCQFGANELAERGKDAAEILRYYYPKSRLTRAYE